MFAGFRFFPHYFIQLHVPLALAAAPWLDEVIRRPLSRAGRLVIAWTAVMLVGFTVANAVLYLGPPGTVYSERLPVYREVAERLRADACAPGATLFVWGFAPNLYYYADLRPASRFVALTQARLTGYIPGNLASNRGDIAAEGGGGAGALGLADGDLERHRATFIVDTAPANLYRWGRYPISDYPRLQRYVDDQFDLVETIREVRIYRRRGCEASGGSAVRRSKGGYRVWSTLMSSRFAVGEEVQTPHGKGVVREVRNSGRLLVQVQQRSVVVAEREVKALAPAKRRAGAAGGRARQKRRQR